MVSYTRNQGSTVREEQQRVAREGRSSTHKKHDECLSSSAAEHKRARERGGGLLVQPLPGLLEGGPADPGAAAGITDPAAAAVHPAAAAVVQDVPIYSHLTRSRLTSAPAMPRRITPFARHTIASWTLRPVRCRYASRFAWTIFFEYPSRN